MAAEALFLSLVFFLALALFAFLARAQKRGQPGSYNVTPPSPPKLPIIGNLHQFGTIPHHSLKLLSDKHGPLMLLYQCAIPTVVVSCPVIARDCYRTHDQVFENRPLSHAGHELFYGSKNILLACYGDYWKQVRNACIAHFLGPKGVRSNISIVEDEVAIEVDRLARSCSGVAVDVNYLLHVLYNGVASRVILGRKYGGEQVGRGFLWSLKEIQVLFGEFSVADYFPRLAWLDVLSGLDGRLKKISTLMDGFLDEVIADHKERRSRSRVGGENKKDLVDVLLDLQEDHGSRFELSTDHLKALLLESFMAATVNMSVTLEWTMTELITHPKIMKKAQEEVRRLVGKKPRVDMQDIEQMQYLQCIIKETLRLHPPAPLLAPRESSSAITLRGYYFPPKTRVVINAWAIARDPKLWDTPDEFRPQRFADTCADYLGREYHYLPFGSGRRRCPAIAYAHTTMEIVLANLLRFFDWKLPDGVREQYVDKTEAGGSVSAKKKIPLHLVPTPYNFN